MTPRGSVTNEIKARIVCVSRSCEDVEKAFELLNERRVQLLYTRFPIGKGTFKRNKFISVMFIGSECGNVRRGLWLSYLDSFRTKLRGSAGITVTDKSTLTLHYLVERMRSMFTSDLGDFSISQIVDEYQQRILEQEGSFHYSIAQRRDSTGPVVFRGGNGVRRKEIFAEDGGGAASMDSFAIDNSVPFATCVVPEGVQRVLDAVRSRHGPLNWVTFAANPLELKLVSAGNGGVYELVQNLPDTLWLFGLFRITLCIKGERVTWLVSFQWIGDRFGVVPYSSTGEVGPVIEKILSPFQYEVYLVGAQDLNPKSIIERCYRALEYHMDGSASQSEDASGECNLVDENALLEARKGLRHTTTYETHPCLDPEALYRVFLEEEKSQMEQLFEFSCDRKGSKCASAGDGRTQRPNTSVMREEAPYNAEETLDLINRNEGDIMWGIFEVQ